MKFLLSILIALSLIQPAFAETSIGVQAYNYVYTNITNQTTTNVKSTPGFLHTVTINKPVANSVITIEDNYTGVTGPTIGTITLPASLLAQGPYTAVYDATFVSGMTIYTTGASSDITVTWK